MRARYAARIFGFLAVIVALFQLGLACGMPWGDIAMGGSYPGTFPPAMRIAALIQMIILLLSAAVVWTRARMIFPHGYNASRKVIWVVVALQGIALILNLITPVPWERIIWAPVALAMLGSSFVVARS